MSGTIRINCRVNVVNADAAFDKEALKTNKTFVQTGVGGPSPGRVALPTSDTVISLAGLTTPGFFSVTNHDPTNYVVIGPTVEGAIAPFIKLLPGMSLPIYLAAGVVLRGQANGGTCICSFDGYEA